MSPRISQVWHLSSSSSGYCRERECVQVCYKRKRDSTSCSGRKKRWKERINHRVIIIGCNLKTGYALEVGRRRSSHDKPSPHPLIQWCSLAYWTKNVIRTNYFCQSKMWPFSITKHCNHESRLWQAVSGNHRHCRIRSRLFSEDWFRDLPPLLI